MIKILHTEKLECCIPHMGMLSDPKKGYNVYLHYDANCVKIHIPYQKTTKRKMPKY